MRTFYIFNINKYFTYVYKEKPYKVYKVLEEVYYVKEKDIVLSYRIFEQVACTFNKNKLNEYIKYICSDVDGYHYKNNGHIICNNNEYTKLTINNSNIKIKSNINYPYFLDMIANYGDSIFVCDFNNKDYFWLDKLVQKDCKKEKFLVEYK